MGLHRPYALLVPGQGYIPEVSYMASMLKYTEKLSHLLDEVDEALLPFYHQKFLSLLQSNDRNWAINTVNAQPAILTMTIFAHYLSKKLLGMDLAADADYILGHSLGEFSALTLAGAWDLATAVQIVHYRARLMLDLSFAEPHATYALLVSAKDLASVFRHHKVLANDNSPSQITISGKLTELDRIIDEINSSRRIIRRVVPISKSIPFHNEALGPVVKDLREYVAKFPINASFQYSKIISNLTALPPESAQEAIENACAGASKPVLWKDLIDYLATKEISGLKYLGPGEILSKMYKKDSRFEHAHVNEFEEAG